jgi:hypothetical protein
MSGAICYGIVSRYPLDRHCARWDVLLNCCLSFKLLNCCRLICQVYDVKVVHFKTSLEYRRLEIFHFTVCNQGHDISPPCTDSKLYAAAAIADSLLELIRAGISGAVIAAVLGKIAGAQEAPQTE